MRKHKDVVQGGVDLKYSGMHSRYAGADPESKRVQ